MLLRRLRPGIEEVRLAVAVAVPGAFNQVGGALPTIKGLLRYYREREQQRAVQDSYDSLGACASATDIPITTLKHAKRIGCAAFRGSRVYLAPFIQWFFESPERSQVNYDQERAQHVVLQNAKLKVELRQLKGELLPADEVRRLGAELGSALRKVITRSHRLAPSLVGQPVETIEARLREQEAEVAAQIQIMDDRLEEWPESRGPKSN